MSVYAQRPLALVIGASTGIGLALAGELGRHGFDLVVTADEDAIEEAAASLRRETGAGVEAVHADLTDERQVDELYAQVRERGRPPAVAVLNAGVGAGGRFAEEVGMAEDLRVVDLNVRSTVQLAKHVARDMVAAGHGRMLFTSSIAAGMPGTYQATYNASKAFVQSFALALRAELAGSGVSVTILMPGPTGTPFFARNAMNDTRLATGPKDDVADVARDGFEALMRGDERAVSSSLLTKAEHLAGRFLPDRVKAELHRVMSRPGSGS